MQVHLEAAYSLINIRNGESYTYERTTLFVSSQLHSIATLEQADIGLQEGDGSVGAKEEPSLNNWTLPQADSTSITMSEEIVGRKQGKRYLGYLTISPYRPDV